MKKILVLITLCLLIVSCKGMGQAISSTQPMCCCRLAETPQGMQKSTFVHMSMCSPPAYQIATKMGADPLVNNNPGLCEEFCTMAIPAP